MSTPGMPRTSLLVITLCFAASTARAQQLDHGAAHQQALEVAASLADRDNRDSQKTAGPRKPNFFRELANEEKAIWLSPAKIRKKDLSWLVPLAAGTGILITYDRDLSGEIREDGGVAKTSRIVSHLGDGYSSFGGAGAIYLIGKISHNQRASETGEIGLRALMHSAAVATALKVVTNRQRPNEAEGAGRFWASQSRLDSSFPSLHASTTWALATVIAEEYSDLPIVRWGAYGWASVVSVSRVTGKRHFTSDVLVGAVIGHLIGRFVARRDGAAGRAMPSVSGFHDLRSGSRLMKLSWTL
jgi:hypothetical protein